MSASRVWISAMRAASVAVSASAMRLARSLSAASTKSSSVIADPGASCATCPIFAAFGNWIAPLSGAHSPVIRRKSEVLPVPFLPTNPALAPVGITTDAPSRSVRPAMRKVRSVTTSMGACLEETGGCVDVRRLYCSFSKQGIT